MYLYQLLSESVVEIKHVNTKKKKNRIFQLHMTFFYNISLGL
jgi:hypothetical protein